MPRLAIDPTLAVARWLASGLSLILDNAVVGELVVVTGPPGAGKSSVSEELAKRWKPSALVPGDAFFHMIKQGFIPPWLPQAHRQNTVIIEAAGAAAGRLCDIGFVVFEGIIGPWFLSTFARATGLADLHYVVLLPPLDVCIARIDNRVDHAFSNVPVTHDLHRAFAAAALDARHVITDSDSQPAGLAELIKGQLGRGVFRYSRP